MDRAVDASGNADLAGHKIKVGAELARGKVTLRLDGHLIHGIPRRCTRQDPAVPDPGRRPGRAAWRADRRHAAARAVARLVSVQRKVPRDGVIMVTRQRLRVGATYAGKIVTVHVEDTHFRITCDGIDIALHPRDEQRPVTRWRAKVHAPKPGELSSMS